MHRPGNTAPYTIIDNRLADIVTNSLDIRAGHAQLLIELMHCGHCYLSTSVVTVSVTRLGACAMIATETIGRNTEIVASSARGTVG